MTYWTKEPAYVRRFREEREAMSILRPYLKSNEVAVDRDVLDEWMNKLHRVGITLDKAQDALAIRNEIYTILGQPRWTDKQSLTVEGDAALDELARHEATVAVPVETLERWLDVSAMTTEDVFREIKALLSTNAENGSGTE